MQVSGVMTVEDAGVINVQVAGVITVQSLLVMTGNLFRGSENTESVAACADMLS